MSILILSNTEDSDHTGAVVNELAKLNKQAFLFTTDTLGTGESNVSLSLKNGTYSYELSNPSGTIRSQDIVSVWYRRPNVFRIPVQDSVQRKAVEEETKSCLDGLWLATKKALWVNPVDKLMVARKKTYQLFLANQLGFDIPESVITNNPDLVTSFYQSHKGHIVYKTLGTEYLDYGVSGYMIPTTRMTKQLLSYTSMLKLSPSLFQEEIDRKYEIRVTIIGNIAIAVHIEPKRKDIPTDWRQVNIKTDMSYTPMVLSEEIFSKCLKLTSALGLVYASIDLCVDTTGKVYFFEINPNGQWYWLEYTTGVPIAKSIAHLLAFKK